MSYLLKLKLADAAEWLALRDAHLSEMAGVQTVEIGTVRHTTGATQVVDGMTVPVTIPVPGFLVDLIVPVVPVALYPYLVNPVEPRHVWYGHQLVAMPEQLEDDPDTLMMTRGIGAQCTDQQRDAAEIEHVRAKLSAEEREDRKALRAAILAVVEQRAIRNLLVTERDRLTKELTDSAAERNLLLDLRVSALSKRDLAVAQMVGTTGAARAALVVAREAATEDVVRINEALTEEAKSREELQALRGLAGDATVAANAELLRLREVVIRERS